MTFRHHLTAARLRLFARHIGASKRPIILGPWRSEVGFEVLYWLPFLAQLRKTYHWDKSRLVAFSRGGAAAWYDAIGTADLYDYVPIETVRLHTLAAQQRQSSTKQFSPEPWERHAALLAADSLGLSNPIIFHPWWMYRLLEPAWLDQMPMRQLSTWIDPQPIPPLPLPAGLTLPERFVAVRLYSRPTMEPQEPVLLYLRQMIARLAKKQPVVFLTSDERYDDHADMIRPSGANQADLGAFLTPTTNLAVQAAVIQRASLFLGTYGGLSQLAMRLKVPTVACYTSWHHTAYLHLDLTQRFALTTKTPFHLIHVADTEKLAQLL